MAPLGTLFLQLLVLQFFFLGFIFHGKLFQLATFFLHEQRIAECLGQFQRVVGLWKVR